MEASEEALHCAQTAEAPPHLRAEAYLHLQEIASSQGMHEEAFAAGVLAQQYAEEEQAEDLRRRALFGCESSLLMESGACKRLLQRLFAAQE